MSLLRFESSFARIVRSWALIFGVSCLILVAVVAVEEGEWPPVFVMVFSYVVLALVLAVLLGISWRRGLRWVEVASGGVRVANRNGEHAIPWGEIVSYRHYRGRAESWRFDLADGSRVGFHVEGFEKGDDVRLARALYAGLVARGLATVVGEDRFQRVA